MRKILLLLAACLLLTGCASKNTDGEILLPIYGAEEVKYEVATAKYTDISETETLGINIGYPYSVYLTYPADAIVKSYEALKGKKVTKGEVLCELDSSGLDYEIANQQTIVDAAFSVASNGTNAQLQYEIEKSKLDMLLAEREKYTITAPFDGIISRSAGITVGTEAKGGDICCLVSEISKTTFYADNAGSKLRFGQKVQIKVDSEMYEAAVVSAPDIAPDTADKESAGRAVFDLGEQAMADIFENHAMAVSAGWATAYITTEKKNVLAVPSSAIKTVGTDSYVTLVDGSERFRLKVTIGQTLGGFTEIIDGISAGDIVLAQGSGEFM